MTFAVPESVQNIGRGTVKGGIKADKEMPHKDSQMRILWGIIQSVFNA